jgi:nucleoid DNA-binding protein
MSDSEALAKATAKNLQSTEQEARALLASIAGALRSCLEREGVARFPELGVFVVRRREAMEARNLSTGKVELVPATITAALLPEDGVASEPPYGARHHDEDTCPDCRVGAPHTVETVSASKDGLARQLAADRRCSAPEAEKLLGAVRKAIDSCLAQEGGASWDAMGVFGTRKTATIRSRDPETGAITTQPSRTLLTFRADPSFPRSR